MAHSITRRRVLVTGSQAAAVALAVPALAAGRAVDEPASPSSGPRISNGVERPTIELKNVPNKGPALDKSLVFEFVFFAHTNLEVVRNMLVDTPTLVNAAWDWGGGDWETALGAAGHMGRRDIAELLIESGARVELPAAVMLGELALVKAALTAFPRAAKTPGPHGIPLLVHAKKGGERAAPVLEFLQSLDKPKE